MRTLIVGAGISGLALAWHLERRGWEVELVERAPAFRTGGYLIDFFGSGYEIAERMGLTSRIHADSYPVRSVVHRRPDGRRASRFTIPADFAEFASILRGDLTKIIHDDVRAPIRYGVTVEGFEQTDREVTVRLTDGTSRQVDLLVGADGIHSTVRKQLFGPEHQFVRYLDHHAAAFVIPAPELSQQLDEQYQMVNAPGMMAAIHALRGGRVATLFLRHEPDSTLPDDPMAALRRHWAGLGWIVPDLLRQDPNPSEIYYDQVSQIELSQWSRGRVVLLGDACQAVSLFAGHGASLGITAASVLADELTATEATDFSGALTRYQERMRPTVADTQRLGRQSIQWMAPSTEWRIAVRDWFMRLTTLPPVRRLALRAITPSGKAMSAPHREPDHAGGNQA